MMDLDRLQFKSYMTKVFGKVSDIYLLKVTDLISMGFGEKTSQNLTEQLIRSRQESIEDWRFLAAFGVN